MTTEEFSNTFDTLLSSYSTQANFGESSSKQDIVLDEYEKSVLLTQAQDMVVKSYFDKTLNAEAQGFDDSSKRQIDYSSLITVGTGTKVDGDTYDHRGILFTFPDDKVLVVLNEKLEIKEGESLKASYVVIPINYKEYDRQMSRAYTQPLKKQCWRLFQGDKTSLDINSEIIPIEGSISPTNTVTYKVRFIRRPRPIVLQDFSADITDDISIDGVKVKTECELNPVIHMEILYKAVELALVTKRGAVPQQTQKER